MRILLFPLLLLLLPLPLDGLRADTRAAKEVTRNAEPVGTEVLETVAKCLNTQMLQS